MMTKVSDGTKSFFHKTYDVLTPWDSDTPPKPPTHMSGRKKPSARTSKKEKGSLFNWFGQNDEEERIDSVHEFLALPRPSPY